MQEPAESLCGGQGGQWGWVRRGPLCPSTTREGQTCPEWPPGAARPVGITSLWVSREVATHPTRQPILRLIKFCLCSPVPCRL